MPTRRTLRLASSLTALILSLTVISDTYAQGFPGGRPGGGMGGRPPGGGRGGPPRAADGSDVAQRYERMASLEGVIKGIEGLSTMQADSLKRIEARYKADFTSQGNIARRLFESARSTGAPPDPEELRKVQLATEQVRAAQLAEARAVLDTDEQRARFDANVAELRKEEAKRAEEARGRRAPGGRARRGPPGL